MWIYNSLILLNYLIITYSWFFFELVFVIVWIVFIKKFSISFRASLKAGLGLLIITMLFVLIGIDTVAGKIAEISFLFISIGFIQSFIIQMRTYEG
jgi:hypothetical protein